MAQQLKSILFFNPDYHCSFFLRDELRKRGWRAEISVGVRYPPHLLFGTDVKRSRVRNLTLDYVWRWMTAVRYRYVIHYGRLSASGLRHSEIIDKGLRAWCLLLRLFGTRVLYVPTGCRDHLSKRDWQQIDDGRVCGNCGFEPFCRDSENNQNFFQVRRIAVTSLPFDAHQTTEFNESRIRYKSLDLDLFHPEISPSENHRWRVEARIRVLHSHSLETRNLNGKNIKGTPHLVQAVERLKNEGLDVELVNLTRVPSNEMRYHQVQADIVVDQLIYGGVGSTTLECLALGKPVICYLRPSWNHFLTSLFPEWSDCPVISATPDTIYAELRKLVVDDDYRSQVAARSRDFALEFLDVKKNAIELENVLLSLR